MTGNGSTVYVPPVSVGNVMGLRKGEMEEIEGGLLWWW
jgi:hypothetical protein